MRRKTVPILRTKQNANYSFTACRMASSHRTTASNLPTWMRRHVAPRQGRFRCFQRNRSMHWLPSSTQTIALRLMAEPRGARMIVSFFHFGLERGRLCQGVKSAATPIIQSDVLLVNKLFRIGSSELATPRWDIYVTGSFDSISYADSSLHK